MNQDIALRAAEIVNKMTIKEKIGQITQINYFGDNYEETAEAIRKIGPGSIILAGSALAGNEEQSEVNRERIDSLQRIALEETKNGIPILFGRDVIHGHRVVFPNPLSMSCSFDFENIRRCYDAVRQEALNDGIKWTFAPMIDLARDPRWGRIVEGPGEDPYIGACFARAAVKGFQTDDLSDDGAIAACAKHFIGYGACEGGRDYGHTEISDYLLQNTYLPAFRGAIEAGVATVMSSFNDINGIPMSGNGYMLTDILRGQLGFDGFVVSDWDAIRQMTAFSGFAEDNKHAAQLALKSGIDLDMVDNCYLDYTEALISEGMISEEELDKAVLRIIGTKLRMGLFDHPIPKRVSFDIADHIELAKKAAEKSMILLKNENDILPLRKNAVIGLAGPYLHDKTELIGSWALDPDMSLIKSPYEAIRETAPEAELITVPDNRPDEIMFLRDCDCIVLILGESRRVTGEANSLAMPKIPSTQLEIIKQARSVGKPVVGVLCFGRPIALGDIKNMFDAILYAGHGGTCAGQAIASVLFGDAEPSGRLSFSLPDNIGQIPIYYNLYHGARQINGYYNDENPHHRNYRDSYGAPAYPFGYGLSYTGYKYSDFECDKKELTIDELKNGGEFTFKCKLTNIGKRTGSTVTQLYIKDLVACRLRPIRELKAFEKSELIPDETCEIILKLKYSDLGFYLENGEFIVEPGKFEIFIGENCYAEKRFEINVRKG